jgi:DNA-binding response OmpR family regulator
VAEHKLGEPKHVLLIDDDELQLGVREQVLREAGFATSCAENGEAAVAKLREAGARVDVVLTDHMLPGLGGAELVRALRSVAPQVPIVIITGLLEAEPEYEGLAVHFRTKPLPATELIATLREITAG